LPGCITRVSPINNHMSTSENIGICMRHFTHPSIVKPIMFALLIAGIILFCPVNPTYSASSQCNTNAVPGHNTSTNDANADCTGTHMEIGDHVVSLATTSNYSAVLFSATITFLFLIFRRLLLAVGASYLARLSYFWRRHRLIIKPKIEAILLRWLNLIGDSIAYSY